jgi:hypothetical protein
VKRLKLGPLELSARVDPQEQGGPVQESQKGPAQQAGASGWWWERQTHRGLATAFVLLVALGLVAYAVLDPHDFFARPRAFGGLVAAVLLLIVIGRRSLRRAPGR